MFPIEEHPGRDGQGIGEERGDADCGDRPSALETELDGDEGSSVAGEYGEGEENGCAARDSCFCRDVAGSVQKSGRNSEAGPSGQSYAARPGEEPGQRD